MPNIGEQLEVFPAVGGQVCVVASATDSETRRRIAATLADRQDLELSLQFDADNLPFELDSAATVVFACDLDLARDLAVLRRMHRELPGPALIALSPPTTGTGVRRALEAGAHAVVFASELEATLPIAVRAVASGQSVVPRKVRASVERPALSHRERQVLAFVSSGHTNAQIAERLFLSESTIKSHLSSIFSKLGVHSRREAAALFRDLERTTKAAVDLGASRRATA